MAQGSALACLHSLIARRKPGGEDLHVGEIVAQSLISRHIERHEPIHAIGRQVFTVFSQRSRYQGALLARAQRYPVNQLGRGRIGVLGQAKDYRDAVQCRRQGRFAEGGDVHQLWSFVVFHRRHVRGYPRVLVTLV